MLVIGVETGLWLNRLKTFTPLINQSPADSRTKF
jgi:hypothetical protein